MVIQTATNAQCTLLQVGRTVAYGLSALCRKSRDIKVHFRPGITSMKAFADMHHHTQHQIACWLSGPHSKAWPPAAVPYSNMYTTHYLSLPACCSWQMYAHPDMLQELSCGTPYLQGQA
jgi:hypothetical protein